MTLNPFSQSVLAGGTVTFTVAASGTAPSVEWDVSTDGGIIFSAVPGATSSTYTFTATAADNGNIYRALFSNLVSQATTAPATLSVQNFSVAADQATGSAFPSASRPAMGSTPSAQATAAVAWLFRFQVQTGRANALESRI